MLLGEEIEEVVIFRDKSFERSRSSPLRDALEAYIREESNKAKYRKSPLWSRESNAWVDGYRLRIDQYVIYHNDHTDEVTFTKGDGANPNGWPQFELHLKNRGMAMLVDPDEKIRKIGKVVWKVLNNK